jgi:hypothetical protein
MKLCVLLLLCAGLTAHDLYLRPKSFRPDAGAPLRIEYHNGDAFPASQVSTKIERLRDAKILPGDVPLSNLRIEGMATVADGVAPKQPGNFTIVSRTIPNFIELEAPKFEEYLRHEGIDHALAWRKQNSQSGKPGREIYSKYAKAIGFVGKPSVDFSRPAGLAIEFIPLSNPYELSAGKTLPVRLLFRGHPAPNQPIEAANFFEGKVTVTTIGRTNANGEVHIPLGRPGLWKLNTVLMERRADTKEADWESFWASLTFELP